MISKQAQFAEAMVPLLIKVILMTGNASHYDALNEAIDAFFTSHFEFLEVSIFRSNDIKQTIKNIL